MQHEAPNQYSKEQLCSKLSILQTCSVMSKWSNSEVILIRAQNSYSISSYCYCE